MVLKIYPNLQRDNGQKYVVQVCGAIKCYADQSVALRFMSLQDRSEQQSRHPYSYVIVILEMMGFLKLT
eukprot:6486687-Amphidinium_carterae.1